MDCLSTNCSISGDERMVCCWLCLGHYHLKCSGLKPRDADALADKIKYLQWTCPNCRTISVEFYNFFKGYKSEFDDIKNDFIVLQKKLTKYGELFTKFTNLDNFASSPKPKRKRTSKTNSISPSYPKDLNIPPSKEFDLSNTNPPAVEIQNSNSKKTSSVSPLLPSNVVSYANTVREQYSNTTLTNLQTSFPIPINVTPSSSMNTSTNINPVVVQNSNPVGAVLTPKPLRIIPPRKTIFATRFA